MKDNKNNIEKTSEATSPDAQSSLESHRKRAAMLTKAHQVSEQTLQERVESFKNGKTRLSEKDVKLVARALEKGEKISPEGTISLVGDPRRWGGMSGQGSGETYNKLIERHGKALDDLYANQKKERENIMKKIEKDSHNLELVKELDTKRYEHQQAEIKMINHQVEEIDRFKSNHEQ